MEDEESPFIPYDDREEYNDVKPIPQNDGEHPVCAIDYSPEYVNTMDYFRAFFQKKEISERALSLVTEAITLNPANYTAWYYRRKILFELKKDLGEELVYLGKMIEKNEKNYQVWSHRQKILEHLGETGGLEDFDFDKEKEFIKEMLDSDAKNYHCWSYREWIVTTFKLWDGEFDFTEYLIKKDLRNNSSWNYRFFLLENRTDLSSAIRIKEIDFTWEYMKKAPNNESVWNYVVGLVEFKSPYEDYLKVARYLLSQSNEFYKLKGVEKYFNSFLFSSMVTINEVLLKNKIEQECGIDLKRQSVDLLKKLAELDDVRKKYWEMRLQKVVSI